MSEIKLAGYAFHSMDFIVSIEEATKGIPSPESASIHLKCLLELDRHSEAVAQSLCYLKAFPESGLLNYQAGIAHYLAKMSISDIEPFFLEASSYGHKGGYLGMAFLAISEKRHRDGIQLLISARSDDQEMEHIRHLMISQGHIIDENLFEAEHNLKISDHILKQSPSLLRHMWGQICWVRLLRAQGKFETASIFLERTMEQLDPKRAPRLYRNAAIVRQLIDEKNNLNHGINYPPGVPQFCSPQIAGITRKPMLNSLYKFLTDAGIQGATKEDIASEVWEESYNPLIHDDRIYKAVGRLRKLLGDNVSTPTLLTQQGRKYALNLAETESWTQ